MALPEELPGRGGHTGAGLDQEGVQGTQGLGHNFLTWIYFWIGLGWGAWPDLVLARLGASFLLHLCQCASRGEAVRWC